MLLHKDGTVHQLSLAERVICAEGSAERATKEQQAKRARLLAPLREVKEPSEPYYGRVEQVAVTSL